MPVTMERDLKAALRGTDPSIPLVFVSGNHDLGNTPTPSTLEQYCSAWGDDYFSFWEPRPKHVLVFQHIPLYLKSPDEDDDYFNLQREVRQSLLERFKRAGETVQHFAQGHFARSLQIPAHPVSLRPSRDQRRQKKRAALPCEEL
ncbi:Serine/threonine-protein phosphatase CPPED1 [Liparis tanakae]|uniref:Serine/threonine-protein phosphatase CPPED1 n=1 Tax=Liparis tanakae TaxID=230148 RepID=A0A4Z2HD17_9TELE|nr:Serine/threonine-protein phosphatase CPPED1 [Liparis tanakae]